ncbi:MAG: DNA mismatch repair endonuclease MutL [Candidatus ainarchaeum sp.]|nr:DNA mismatch repair endonuclease MutL [Candidatus ainarchaeum sp.]
MSKIHVLDSSTINKIAAGEVIERPASAVKELVENSIDANSDEIIIKLKDGGKKEITVIDNGTGIEEEDLELTILRHATSKITKIEDIYSILSYGFRGEALSTIADVSKMEITSAIEGYDHSNVIEIENGLINRKTMTAFRKGTSITVQNLFYNIPARQKFLKTTNYELKKIIDWIKCIAISNPKVNFKIIVDGKETYNFQKKTGYEERVNEIHFDIAKNLAQGTYKDPLVSAIVFVTKPNKVSESKGVTQIYINNRPIKNFTVLSAIKKAFEAKIPKTYRPDAFIFLEINPKIVDVNVHPQKLEVRVKEDSLLFLPTFYAVKNALEQIKEAEIDKTRPTQLISTITARLIAESETKAEKGDMDDFFIKAEKSIQKSLDILPEEMQHHATPKIKNFKIIGQIFNTYILVEKNNSFYIIDQHVAEERYNFEQIQTQYHEHNGLLKQELLVPFGFLLPVEDRGVLLENKDELGKLGFEIDELKDELLVRTIPLKIRNSITKEETKELLKDVIRGIKADITDKQAGLFATIACKMSVKAGTPLNEIQMEKIIENLFDCENPFTCPHGRPIFIELSKDRIEKEVSRK